jgi:hypothetical protein
MLTKNFYETIGQNSFVVPFDQKNFGTCLRCRPKRFELAVRSVKLKIDRRASDPKSILMTDGKNVTFKVEDDFTEMSRKHSREIVFNNKSAPNDILELIRQWGSDLRNSANAQTKQEIN